MLPIFSSRGFRAEAGGTLSKTYRYGPLSAWTLIVVSRGLLGFGEQLARVLEEVYDPVARVYSVYFVPDEAPRQKRQRCGRSCYHHHRARAAACGERRTARVVWV
jgi:hypothetical protein